MAKKHKIKAQLYDNVLSENPNDLIARVYSDSSLSIKDIAELAVKRGGADISALAMQHAVELWMSEMAYSLCDGFSVNAGWFIAAPKIRGSFDSPAEKFNPEKHSVAFDIRQGILLRKELADVEINITGAADVSAAIMQVKDSKTGSVNDLVTPGRPLRISGSKLKVAGENPSCGVWFINDQTGERRKAEDSDIINNNRSELVVLAPALEPGMYRLEVATQFSAGASTLKEPRTAAFDRMLTVVPSP